MNSRCVIIILFLVNLVLSKEYYGLRPMKLGVEAVGINLRDHINNTNLFLKLKRDVYQYRIILFRNQGQIPADQFIAMFDHRFGDAFGRPFTTQGKGAVNHDKSPAPAIMRISNDKNEGYQNLGTSGWHIDGAYKPMPFSFLLFNAVNASTEGNTKFVGHREIMASMKKSMLKKLDHLWTAITRTVLGDTVYEIHPIIHTHPVVNESVFCLHLGYTRGVISNYGTPNQINFNLSQMFRLKGEISHEIKKDNERLIYSHKWRQGDLIILDNWQIVHMASKETQFPKEKIGLRVLHRLAINGTQRPRKTHFIQ